jgi:tRNA uridine 5-carboxymethylaminomethyl modification enzyme
VRLAVTERFNAAGFESGRMKTGTPPRVDGRSLDYSKMNEKEMPNRISFPIQM